MREGAAFRATVVDIPYRLRVGLDRHFQLAQLPVPYFDGAIIRAGGDGRELGIESDAVYGASV